MRKHDEINFLKKEFVYEQYTRIVKDFKDYEKITREKMLDAIYDVYSDYHNIIDICTVRELKYLKIVLENDNVISEMKEPEYFDKKYDWEIRTLRDKFLLMNNYKILSIPSEIVDNVKNAVKNSIFKQHKNVDYLNYFMVSYCKIHGFVVLETLINLTSEMFNTDKDVVYNHVFNNKLFNYYVYIEETKVKNISNGSNILIAIYQDFYDISDELIKQRELQGILGNVKIDLKKFETLFYNDFDVKNPKIKKFLVEIKKLPFFWTSAIKIIREFSMLNIDRTSLKDSISAVPSLEYVDLTDFFKILDDAMDEMPSGALNGFTPNEAKAIKLESIKNSYNKERRYVKQKNACLSKSDADLFYKIYFALLEYTNVKYNINKKIKIYKKHRINPYTISDIIEIFWKNKNEVVLEFCHNNPYKFDEEEIKIASEFKNGIRDMFVIADYEEEYTAVINKEKVYMIKGINDNMDNVISYKDIPYITITSVIPFKNFLVYDGILIGMNIRLDSNFSKIVEEELNNSIKYYHL